METQAVKIMFGDPAPGCARVFIDEQELHNVAAMALSNLLPGQIPTVTFEIHAPNLQIEGQAGVELASVGSEKGASQKEPSQEGLATRLAGPIKALVSSEVAKMRKPGGQLRK